jgi:hypothetical protein
MKFVPGDIISYMDMCQEEGTSLQRGMNFRLAPTHSVILMSLRKNAPYADRVEQDGRILIYEGHDIPKSSGSPDPKEVDQPEKTPLGRLMQNGLFAQAAAKTRDDGEAAEPVRVYEKLRDGIWVFCGTFLLKDSWREQSEGREVFKFRLEMNDTGDANTRPEAPELEHNRMIPAAVKLAVWQRDKGKCVKCGSKKNLHFDHVIPYSKGGSSLVVENIQLLCAQHNLIKHDALD